MALVVAVILLFVFLGNDDDSGSDGDSGGVDIELPEDVNVDGEVDVAGGAGDDG